jgi:hypothetical protein
LREYVDHFHANIPHLFSGGHQHHGGLTVQPMHGVMVAWWSFHAMAKRIGKTFDQCRPPPVQK